MSALLQSIELLHDAYAPYPHYNGFLNDRTILLVKRSPVPTLVEIDLETGTAAERFAIARQPSQVVDFDVARDGSRLVFVQDNTIMLADLSNDTIQPFYRPAEGRYLEGCTINHNGSRMLFLEVGGGRWDGRLLDVESREPRTLFSKDWRVGHVQFCPFDENWIGFCHEGLTTTIPDRVWGWHARLAPHGRCLFDQRMAADLSTRDRGEGAPDIDFLCAGHERWAFHDAAFVVCAYGDSPMDPRGLYLGYADGRPTKLVSHGNRDWHCDISPDGQWALVDTIGPHDLPGRGWATANNTSDILLIDVQTGRREHLVRNFLPENPQHPQHPHPIFSPDGRFILYNSNRIENGRTIVSVAVIKR